MNRLDAAAVCLTLLLVLPGDGYPDGNQQGPVQGVEVFQMPAQRTISWEEPVSEKGKVELPGWVRADFGRFEFRWLIAPDGNARLATLVPAGSGEIPPMEKELWPLVLDGEATALFQEWFPLLNVKAPTTLRLIVVVSTEELFSVLPGKEVPPASGLSRKPMEIRWTGAVEENAVLYVRGTLSGKKTQGLALYWKREAGRPPALAGRVAAGEDSTEEFRLVPWMDEAAGVALLCREVRPQAGPPPHLFALVTVSTQELLQGFQLLP